MQTAESTKPYLYYEQIINGLVGIPKRISTYLGHAILVRNEQHRLELEKQRQLETTRLPIDVEKDSSDNKGLFKLPLFGWLSSGDKKVQEELPKDVEESPLKEVLPNDVEETPLKEASASDVEETPLKEVLPKDVEETPLNEALPKDVEETPLKEVLPKDVEETPLKEVLPNDVEDSPLKEASPKDVLLRQCNIRKWN
jgi:hypothetical protein